MKTVEIYDPALCCSSGVCGPSPDAALAAFASALETIKAAGVSVSRYNLAQQPLAFAQKPEVKAALETDGDSALPLISVDGELRFRSSYPTPEQLAKALGLQPKKAPISFVKVEGPKVSAASSNCCDSSSGCC